MITAIPNEFQEFSLSEEDQLRGQVFAPEHLCVLSNMRAGVVRDIINSYATKKEYDEHLEKVIHLKGQLAVLDLLITNHTEAKKELEAIASQNSADN